MGVSHFGSFLSTAHIASYQPFSKSYSKLCTDQVPQGALWKGPLHSGPSRPSLPHVCPASGYLCDQVAGFNQGWTEGPKQPMCWGSLAKAQSYKR